jgi:hypothetical protein
VVHWKISEIIKLRLGGKKVLYIKMGLSKKVVGFVSVNRPGFYGNNFCPDGHVLFNVDGPVDHMVPDWRVIGAIDDVYLYLDSPRERRIASILSHSLQLVRLALHDKKGSPEKKRDEKLLASDIKIWFSGVRYREIVYSFV